MLATLQQTLAQWTPDRPLRKAVLAVSGGADSMALLQALHRLWTPKGITLVVVHVHHKLRGRAADEDAAFVRAAAKRLGLPFVLARVDVPAALRDSPDSLEMAARDLRRDALRRIARRTGADAVCTGHTADDQLETLFLRLGRGTGPRGLGGMAPRASRPGMPPVLRPLIDCRRAELRAWLRREGVAWREDASNQDETVLRNRVRLSLVPAFEHALGPAAAANALRSLALLRDEQDGWLAPLVDAALETALAVPGCPGTLDLRALGVLARPLARRVLLAWLQRQGVSPSLQTLALLDRLTAFALAPGRGSRRLPLGQGRAVLRQYDHLQLGPDPAPSVPARPAVLLALPGRIFSTAWGLEVLVTRTRGILRAPSSDPRALPQRATLSVAAVGTRGLVLRAVRPGDRLAPLGLGGRRKVSDLLIDRKIPREGRGAVPVIACGNDVAWLPGIAVSAPFAVPDAQAPAYRITLRTRTRRSGVTLVEALIALALVGLVLVPALVSMQSLLRAEQRLAARLDAELCARDALEEAVWSASAQPERTAEIRVTRDAARGLRLVVRHRPAEPQAPARLAVDVAADGPDPEPLQAYSRLLFPKAPPDPGALVSSGEPSGDPP